MTRAIPINWTNKSVRALAGDADPVEVIEKAARSLVLKARERGWQGPPFDPFQIVEMLGAQIEANSSIADARLIATDQGPTIEYNPRQPRERVRFSIAHEVAHLLFPDWQEQTRNRGGEKKVRDDWQLEMLCNLAASEFVLPIGSLSSVDEILPIEELMHQRRQYDVSAEAFLIRLAHVSIQPITVFFASPLVSADGKRHYKVDYRIDSPTAPKSALAGLTIPEDSIVHSCTAIGHTDRAVEDWMGQTELGLECVGLSPFPGSAYPRVAGLIRYSGAMESRSPINLLHGDILAPSTKGPRVVCQLVNDKATKWGGGVARKFAKMYPDAEIAFSAQVMKLPRADRLGKVIFTQADDETTIASLIAQEGFGRSLFPRIRYGALRECLISVADFATSNATSINMPKIGTGAAGGDWSTIEELVEDTMVRAGLKVNVYDPPPKRIQLELF